jgi:hypothetical protein
MTLLLPTHQRRDGFFEWGAEFFQWLGEGFAGGFDGEGGVFDDFAEARVGPLQDFRKSRIALAWRGARVTSECHRMV